MNQEEAILTLGRDLARLGYVNIITEESLKSKLLEHGRWAAEGKTIQLDLLRTLNNLDEDRGSGFYPTRKSIKKSAKTNYLFMTNLGGFEKNWDSGLYGSGQRVARELAITPLAIIGKREEKILKETYYKKTPSEIREAMDALEITSYEDNYKRYLSGDIKGILNEIQVGDIVCYDKKHKGKVERITKDKKGHKETDKIYCFWNNESDLGFMDREDCKITQKVNFSEEKRDFFNFVFTLPEEEQDISANKELLKRFPSQINYRQMLMNLYTKGIIETSAKRFKEYFKVLDKNYQENLVEKIKTLENGYQKQIMNTWLLSLGFEGLFLKHLELYKNENPELFIKYFSGLSSREEQESILKDILEFGKKSPNKVIDKYLEDKHADLVKTAGRDGLTGVANS